MPVPTASGELIVPRAGSRSGQEDGFVVLQLGPYPPPHGGVQTNLVAIRNHLRASGVAAPVINLTRHRRADADDVFYPESAAQVMKLLLTMPADVIHLHIGGNLTARLLALCLFCSLLPGRRTVLTFHSGGYPSSSKARRLRRWSPEAFVMRRLDAVIAVNAEIAGVFRDLGVEPSRINTICPYAPVEVREDLELPPELAEFVAAHSPLLTTVGLLEPEYDLALQISALGAIRETFRNAGLIVIGSGSLEGDLRRHLDAQPWARHVLLCGDVRHALTVRAIAASDAFMRTTLYDGDSVSVREALQLGVPVIATDNGMRPAGVHLVPRADARALVAAVARVLRDPAKRSRQPDAGELEDVMNVYAALLGGDVRTPRRRIGSVS